MTATFKQLTVTASLPAGEYYGVAISPDGNWVAGGPSGGRVPQVLVRDAATGNFTTVQAITGVSTAVAYYDLAFGPNNDKLYFGEEGVGIWRATLSGGVWTKDATVLKSDGRQFRGISISPDGLKCGYVTSTGSIVVFEIANPSNLYVNFSSGQIGEDCKFSVDGRWFGATIRGGVGCLIYSTTTWTPVTPTGISASNVSWNIEFSADGNHAIGGAANSGTATAKMDFAAGSWTGSSLSTAFQAVGVAVLDNDLMMSFDGVGVAVPLAYRANNAWAVESHNLPGTTVHATRGTLKGKQLAAARTAAAGGGIAVFEMGLSFATLTTPAALPVVEYYGVAISPDANWIALGPSAASTTVKILQKNSGDDNYGTMLTVAGLPLGTGAISDLVFGPNSDTLYIPVDTKIHRCTLVGGVWTYDKQFALTIGGANGIDIDPAERLLTVGTGSGIGWIWNIVTDTLVQQINFADAVQDTKFSPNGRYVGFVCQSTIGLRVYDRGAALTDTFTAMPVSGGGPSVANWALQFNADSDRIVAGSIFSGNASSGFKLDSANGQWIGQTLQTGHNITAATYVIGEYPLTISYDGAVSPDIWHDKNFAASATNLPVLRTHAARAGIGKSPASSVLVVNKIAAIGSGIAVYKTQAPSISFTTSTNIVYPKFGVAGQVAPKLRVDAAYTFQTFAISANGGVPIGAQSDYLLPVFRTVGAAGAFPPDYPDAQPWAWQGIIGVENLDFQISDEVPAETWLYSYINFSKFNTDGSRVDVNAEVRDSDLLYSRFQIYMVSGTIDGTADIVYPKFSIDADVFDYDELRSNYFYPLLEIDVSVHLYNEVNGDYSYPNFDADGLVEFVLANGAIVYPKFEVAVDAASQRSTVEIVYAKFEVSSEMEVPIGVVAPYSYSKMTMAGNLNVPIGVTDGYDYPTLEYDGVSGVRDLITGDIVLPKFKVDARIGYTQSVDTTILYRKFVINGIIGPPAKFTADIVYPKFSSNFVVDNYYGASMDAEINIDFEGDVEYLKSRKNFWINEN